MDQDKLLSLIKAVSDSNLTVFEWEQDGICIKMKTDKKENQVIKEMVPATMTQRTIVEAEPVVSTSPKELEGQVVRSPLVGTFYSSPSPDDEPFIQVGDTVKKGQVLGIVEAMKLMNEIESEYDGVVKEILVSDAGVVEYDQPMFVIG